MFSLLVCGIITLVTFGFSRGSENMADDVGRHKRELLPYQGWIFQKQFKTLDCSGIPNSNVATYDKLGVCVKGATSNTITYLNNGGTVVTTASYNTNNPTCTGAPKGATKNTVVVNSGNCLIKTSSSTKSEWSNIDFNNNPRSLGKGAINYTGSDQSCSGGFQSSTHFTFFPIPSPCMQNGASGSYQATNLVCYAGNYFVASTPISGKYTINYYKSTDCSGTITSSSTLNLPTCSRGLGSVCNN